MKIISLAIFICLLLISIFTCILPDNKRLEKNKFLYLEYCDGTKSTYERKSKDIIIGNKMISIYTNDSNGTDIVYIPITSLKWFGISENYL